MLARIDIPAAAAEPAATETDRFEQWVPAMRKFEQQDNAHPDVAEGIVFVGSSSVRLWDLAKWFPTIKPTPLNRGFGGSQIADATHFADLLVLKHKPRTIVFYSGDNDIAAGNSAEQVAHDFAEFCKRIWAELPETKIVFLSVKPSPSRWKFAEIARDANARIREQSQADERLHFVDLWTPMLGGDGQPRRELFREDMLHLNELGYAIWASSIGPMIND